MRGKDLDSEPLVSIVTPFYNTEKYLSQCIESVLGQTYKNWEYILVNNCSTDRSLKIGEEYANRYGKIRIYNNAKFLTQLQNYNNAVRFISNESKYCKIVQSDDWMFRECIAEMVQVAERNPTVGVVGSYWLNDTNVLGDGLPYPSTFISGKDICRWHLLRHPDMYVFGTPTTLLIRSDIIRNRNPFYDDSSILGDLEVCYELLKNYDFGFVHQVLTFTRVDNESITGKIRHFFPFLLHAFICLKKYGQEYLSEVEYNARLEEISQRYFRCLAKAFLYGHGNEFWVYHRNGLKNIGYKLTWGKMAKYALGEISNLLIHPRAVVHRLMRGVPRDT